MPDQIGYTLRKCSFVNKETRNRRAGASEIRTRNEPSTLGRVRLEGQAIEAETGKFSRGRGRRGRGSGTAGGREGRGPREDGEGSCEGPRGGAALIINAACLMTPLKWSP
ncbi:hypothetical protein EVAR_53615_1 [Eumeta japonica]|uniref:Uncharacterized protein n=1 Tax=Eumeta variegata TaxID=151549 RepID=A0A4C1WYV8_EUMVA|nr:hypothetical protein EVAR_53615_1 [Eumeta japonica]